MTRQTLQGPIRLKRIYLTPSPDDGMRILVERLWPRGLTKAEAAIDHWAKEVAPSPGLRKWYRHRPDRWDDFQRRYRSELANNRAALDALDALCGRGRTTFVFAARDEARNGAVLLRNFLTGVYRP